MVRRIGALVVLTLVAVGTIKLAGVLVGSDSTDAAAPDTSTGSFTASALVTTLASTPETTLAATSGVPADAAVTTVVSSTEPPSPGGVPTVEDPAVVLIAGDSDAGTFGPYLETLLGETGITRTQLDYKVSSGLSRPDFFDWPAHFRETIPVVQPDIVVVTFGGNDPQGLAIADGTFIVDMPTGDEGGDAEWRAEYGTRVGEVMDYLSADGRTLVWVGIPNDDNDDVTARLAVQNEVVKSEAAKRPQVVFVDTWKRFSGRQGNWAEYVIDPRDGIGKDVRADDGFHLNTTGAEILALDIADALRGVLRARGAAI